MTTQMTLFDSRPEATIPRYTYVFSDGIDRRAMARAFERMDSVTDSEGRVHMLFEIDEVPPVSFGALVEKATHFRELTKLKGRYAVVTDQKWLAALAPLASLMTHVELRVFSSDRLEEATRWARAN